MKPKKILLLTTSDAIGGMQRIVFSLARQFAARGNDVQAVFPESADSPAFLAWARDHGVDAEVSAALPDAGGLHSVAGIRALRRFVRERKPDVVNLHYGDIFISAKDVLAVRLAGMHRCVVSVYHPTPWAEAGEAKRRSTGLAARLAHAVIVESEATREVLAEAGVSPRKTHLIPCGLHVPSVLPSRAEARAALGVPDDAFVIGSVSRQFFHKGIIDLIEASAAVADPERKLVLLIAGDGPEQENFAGIAAERLGDRARILGHVARADLVYAALDVFTLPSYREGFGLVYVEAAFHGVPSIGGDTGGVREAIKDGETGILVTPGDRAGITRAIETLRDDPALRGRLGAAARDRAHAEFTESVMADRYSPVLGV